MIETPAEALRFFVEKVVTEAALQHVSLSANERKTLEWSEVEAGGVADPEEAEGLAGEMSDETYEGKIGSRLEAAYQRDLTADPTAKNTYRDAYAVLRRGDYYLAVMIEEALGRRLRRWWQLSMV